MNFLFKNAHTFIAALIFATQTMDASSASNPASEKSAEILDVKILAYDDLIRGDVPAIADLKQALLQNGIVGIRSIPGYKQKVINFIQAAKEFAALPDEVKQKYAPNREAGDMLGYEIGKEKFQRPDGSWIVDDSKSSYYAIIPPIPENKWPLEGNLQISFEEIGDVMFETAKKIVTSIGLAADSSPIVVEKITGFGRMLHYVKQSDATMSNPLWCGAHFDHSLLTALLPSVYFVDGQMIPEPAEAGLFVRLETGTEFRKVIADDQDVLLFQVGEFGQLVTNDAIKATEHRVHKALNGIERFTLALFMSPAMDTVIESQSILSKDARYGNAPDHTCTFQEWHEASLKRYLVKDD